MNSPQAKTLYGKSFMFNSYFNDPNAIIESDWVPDRFSSDGWKYQARGTKNKFLNHPNKVNYLGFLYHQHLKEMRTS